MSGTNSSTDAAIPLQAGQGVPQPANPLQTIGQFAETKALLNQNALFPGQQQLQQQQIQTGQLGLNKNYAQTAYNAITPLLALPPGQITHDELTTALGSVESNLNIPTHGVISDILATAPTSDGPAFDSKVRALIAARSQTDAGSSVDMVTPTGGTVDTGGGIQFGQIGPRGLGQAGTFTKIGAPIGKSLTPESLATQETYPADAATAARLGVPVGTPVTTTLGQRLNQEGAGALTGPAGASLPSGMPQQPSPSPSNPPRLAAATPPPGSPIISGIGPGTAAAIPPTAEANAHQAIGLQTAAAGVPAQKALLGNLQSALGQFTAGGGADWKNVAKTFVNANNPFGNVFPVDRIASQDEFGKMAFQLAQSQFQTLGGTGTDAQLNSTMHTSPSTFLSNQSNENIINLLKGNADAIGAMNSAWQNKWLPTHGYDTSTYGQFQNQWNQNFDPRVFQSAYMNQAQRYQMTLGMSKDEKGAFQQKYNNALKAGMIPDPRAPQPAASAPGASAEPVVPTN